MCFLWKDIIISSGSDATSHWQRRHMSGCYFHSLTGNPSPTPHRSQFSNLLLHHASWVWHNPQFKMSCCFPLIISLKFDPIKVSVLFVFPFLKKWESICHRSVQMDLRPPFNVPVMAFKYRIPLPSTTSLKHRLPMVIKCNILVDWACAPHGVAAGWPCCLPEWVCVCFCLKKNNNKKNPTIYSDLPDAKK